LVKRRKTPESLATRVAFLVDHFHGGSINDAAKALGVAQPTIGRIVRGQVQEPRAGLVSRMSELWGVTTDWLLRGVGEPPVLDDDSSWYRRWKLFVLSFLGDSADPEAKAILLQLPLTPVYAALEIGAALGDRSDASESLGEEAAAEIAQAWRRLLERLPGTSDKRRLISAIRASERTLFPSGPIED
jgi:transcriptional regulator with XRE-family HTH domain